MKKIGLFILFFTFVCVNFQAQAAYAVKTGSKSEKKEKFAACEKLLEKFVISEKFKKIFERIIFNENLCCKVLFNGDRRTYNAWLNTIVQRGIGEDSNQVKEPYTIRLKDALNKIRNKTGFFTERQALIGGLVKMLPRFFYEDPKRKITWDSKTNFEYGDSICLCGFTELLKMLTYPEFYCEIYNEDFAIRCRIFVVVYFILLLECSADALNAVELTKDLKKMALNEH